MKRLRAAIVGAGLMGRWHAHAVRRAGACVAAVVDSDPARAVALARHHGARSAAFLRDVLGSVDVVHVCTPTSSHAALVTEALDAHRHVLAEKPLAVSAAETRRLVELAAARGAIICPVHQFPWQRGVLKVLQALPSLGTVRHVDVVTCSAGATRIEDLDTDAVAIDILPHPLAVLARVLPSVLSEAWTVRKTGAGEYRLLTCASGASVTVLISMAGRPTVNAMRVIADAGTAHVNLFHGYAVIERGSVSRLGKVIEPFAIATTTLATAGLNLAVRAVRREPAYPGLNELTACFYAAVASGSEPPIPGAETMAIAEAVDGVRRQVNGDSRA